MEDITGVLQDSLWFLSYSRLDTLHFVFLQCLSTTCPRKKYNTLYCWKSSSKWCSWLPCFFFSLEWLNLNGKVTSLIQTIKYNRNLWSHKREEIPTSFCTTSLAEVRLKIILTGNFLSKKRVRPTEYQSIYSENCFIIISDPDNAVLSPLWGHHSPRMYLGNLPSWISSQMQNHRITEC